jgi:hypothetical protein
LYPVLPTSTDILYGVNMAFNPPEYRLQIPFQTNASSLSFLVSKTSDVSVSGAGLVPAAPFTSQSGQEYMVYSAPEQRVGTTFSATISSLPGVDNSGTLQTLVLVGGGFGALVLLAYPVYQRRVGRAKIAAPSERVARLQSIARLDDAFESGDLSEEEYYAQRAGLKADLLKDVAETEEKDGA